MMRRILSGAAVLVGLLAGSACGIDRDRSMDPPEPDQFPVPATEPTDEALIQTADTDGGDDVLDDPDDPPATPDLGAAGTGEGTLADETEGDDRGRGGGNDRGGRRGNDRGGPRGDTTPGQDPQDGDQASPGTGLSPWPSPPPEGVETTLFEVRFDIRLPWDDGEEIPDVYTCDASGPARSPLVAWFPPPARTVELALVVIDEDADGFVHWVAAGIEPTLGALAPTQHPAAMVEAINDFGEPGWGAPCPPPGDGEHTYHFTLYAADQRINIADGASADEMIAAIEEAAFRSVSVTGVYSR